MPPRSREVRRVPGSKDVRAVPSDVRAVPASPPKLSLAIAPPLPALTLDALELRRRMLGSAAAAAHTWTRGQAADAASRRTISEQNRPRVESSSAWILHSLHMRVPGTEAASRRRHDAHPLQDRVPHARHREGSPVHISCRLGRRRRGQLGAGRRGAERP